MTQSQLKKLLNRHIERIDRAIKIRLKRNLIYSRGRIAYFVVALFSMIYYIDLVPDAVFISSLIGWIVGFLVILHQHRKVYSSLDKFEHLKTIKQEHIARMELDWEHIPLRKMEVDVSGHPFAGDFNIPGKRGMFHLLDTSVYEGGGKRLMDWLTNISPEISVIKNRQQLVRELIPLQIFRDKLRVINLFTTGHVSEKDWTIEDMLAWLKIPANKKIKNPLLILSALALINAVTGILALLGQSTALFWLVGMLIYLMYYKTKSALVSGLFNSAYNMEKILTRFKASLLHVEGFRAPDESMLTQLLEPFHKAKSSPSAYLKKINNLMSRASLQVNQLVWLFVNAVMPWDMYHALKLEQIKAEFRVEFEVWVDTFYELEVLSSIANFAALNPSYNWPEFSEVTEGNVLRAIELGHPLIKSELRVSNNFSVEKGKDLFLITGSNMAGKSTFLRTIGTNLVLAFAGSVVSAQSLHTGLFRLFTSINVTDSLGDGLSHFYAEVRRLRGLLDQLHSPQNVPLFFFVDEIYRGTNNRERYAGSAAFLKAVAGKDGIGMVTTHDLELSELEHEIPQLSNWHFSETIENGKMSFSYKIKSGPCPSTNALEIMRIEGLPT